MKAMMSERLRDLLSNPQSARELQKQLLASHTAAQEHSYPKEQQNLAIKPNNHDHQPSK